ncbi:MAG: hypothetical protein PWQ12_1930 [Clostridiales bacterium]|jgi:ribosomal 50S subunit-recycling heat shock protein|nr:hypothetical protein [Clostridiales bacterium]
MRIDKFLKNARLIKRRTLAKEACDGGRVKLNGKTAKAGAEVAVGDRIDIQFGASPISIRVISLDEHVTKEASKSLYEMIEG